MDGLSSEERQIAETLLRCTFFPESDTFYPVAFPCQPLSFDRICGGCTITSSCPIFRLPIELHSNVLRYLDRVDLANLALVDRDCRQLARSVQFAIIHLSVNRASVQLITQIFGENVPGDKEDGRSGYKLGPCIRRLIVGSTAANPLDIQHDIDGTNLVALRMRAALDMYNVLMSLLSACLPSAFPNLELFQFTKQVCLRLDLLQALSKTQLRHLSFDNFLIDDSFCGVYDSLGNGLAVHAWSGLRTLHVAIHSILVWDDADRKLATKRALLTMLRTVAPSLESLKLRGLSYIHHVFADFPADFSADFPRLRRLHLEEYCFKSDDGSSFLSRILPAHNAQSSSLESLQLERVDISHLVRLGHLPTLVKLVINDISLRERTANFAPLAANPQLELLSFTFPIRTRTLRDDLLPLIHSSGFSSLRVLRLTFASAHASRRVIAAIGLIPSLEMLWLSAGQQIGWQHDWFIDHSVLQTGLKGLRRLRELAFTRESYHSGLLRNHERDGVRLGYYSYPALPPGVHAAELLTAEDEEHLRGYETLCESERVFHRSVYLWEKWHHVEMYKLAKEYADLFPRLEFIFIGQWPMAIARHQRLNDRTVYALSDHRESYLTELNLKWGSQTV